MYIDDQARKQVTRYWYDPLVKETSNYKIITTDTLHDAMIAWREDIGLTLEVNNWHSGHIDDFVQDAGLLEIAVDQCEYTGYFYAYFEGQQDYDMIFGTDDTEIEAVQNLIETYEDNDCSFNRKDID